MNTCFTTNTWFVYTTLHFFFISANSVLSITDQFIKVKSSAYDEIISELKDEFHPGLKPVPEPWFCSGLKGRRPF